MITITKEKPRTLRIGDLVVTVRADGLHLRGTRRRRGVFVAWNAIALDGLEREGYELKNGQQESTAVDQLAHLARLKKHPPRRLLP